MKKKSLRQIAKELEISPSYLSMILKGQRRCPPELLSRLQSIPSVHKVANNYACFQPSKQRVVGSNPSRDASHFLNGKPPQFIEYPDHAFGIEFTVFEKVQPHFFNLCRQQLIKRQPEVDKACIIPLRYRETVVSLPGNCR